MAANHFSFLQRETHARWFVAYVDVDSSSVPVGEATFPHEIGIDHRNGEVVVGETLTEAQGRLILAAFLEALNA